MRCGSRTRSSRCMTARSPPATPGTSRIPWRRAAPGATGPTKPAAPISSRITRSTTPTSPGGRRSGARNQPDKHDNAGEEKPMHKVKLTIATTDYDHFRDFRTGVVEAQGIDHTWLTLGHHEIFLRFTFGREWDVSELSFAKFVAQVTRDEPDIIGLPVFASRLFRFGSFYINRKSGIKTEAG